MSGNWHLLAFGLLALTILGSGYRVITAPRIAHAVLYLALCLVGVAGIFLLLGADFLAGAQVLIYVGAVTTLIVFALMLSGPQEVRGTPRLARGPAVLAGLAGLGFSAVMLAVYRRMAWPVPGPPLLGRTTVPLGRQLFTVYALPFEVVSLVLLAALVGAIYLSTREGGSTRESGSTREGGSRPGEAAKGGGAVGAP